MKISEQPEDVQKKMRGKLSSRRGEGFAEVTDADTTLKDTLEKLLEGDGEELELHVMTPPNALNLPKPRNGQRQKRYRNEWLARENRWGDYDLGEYLGYVSRKLYELSERLGRLYPEQQAHGALGGEWGYGNEFGNQVFEIRPYWWGACTCGLQEEQEDDPLRGHQPDCRLVLPNFRCGDIEIFWYKWIGRGMSINRKVSKGELISMFKQCFASLPKPGPRKVGAKPKGRVQLTTMMPAR